MKNLENNKLIAEFMGAKINFPMNGLEEEATFEKLMFGEDYLLGLEKTYSRATLSLEWDDLFQFELK